MFCLRSLFAVARPSVLTLALSSVLLSGTAEAKLPGQVHCYNDICHRVRTVAETEARRGIVEPLVASFYDSPEKDRFNPSLETSSGTQFEPYSDDNAASPIHPDGTVLLVWSPVTRGAAVIRVNNAGPYYPGRTLDVSRGVADRLGFANGGVMQLLTVVISAPSEPDAHYVRGRVYPKVRGYLGTFDNIALASFAEPVASSAAYQSFTASANLSSSAQIALNVTEEHFRLTELALAFRAAPADVMSPPEESWVVASLEDHAGNASVPTSFAVNPGGRPEIYRGTPWRGVQRTAESQFQPSSFERQLRPADLGSLR